MEPKTFMIYRDTNVIVVELNLGRLAVVANWVTTRRPRSAFDVWYHRDWFCFEAGKFSFAATVNKARGLYQDV